MRRPAAILTVVAVALAAATAALGADGGVRLTPVNSKFPERTYVLSLPKGIQLGARNVQVTENGGPVADVAVSPTGAVAGRNFGTVLLIDTSNSMKGSPLANAYAAARAFAARRNDNQPLGVVTFDRQARVRLPLTKRGGLIADALGTPPQTAEGTHLYDGIQAALNVIGRAGVASGSVVLLSDGADTGSDADAAKTLERARTMHVRVFSVGLSSPQFTPTALTGISAGTGASYTEAQSAKALKQIYNQLGYQLANEYLVQYKSFADPNQPVSVKVSVTGIEGAGTSSYTSPPLPLTPPPAVHKSILDRALESTLTMLVVIAIVAVLLGFTATILLQPGRNELRRRIGAFVSVRDRNEKRPETVAEERQDEVADETAPKRSPWERFVLDVEIAELNLAAPQIAILTLLATLVVAWLVSLASPLFAIFAFLILLLVPMTVHSLAERKRRAFAEQLPDNLQVLSSALRAGHSLIGALSVVVDDAPEPSRREFRQVVADEQVGVPLDEALRRVAARMSSRDLEQVALVAALQRETGGNAAEVLDRVADTLRERQALRRLVRVLTAQGRMARWIVSGIPIALLLIISALNSEYMKPMFTKTLGQVLVVIAGLMVVAGSLVIRKIIDIKI